MIKKYSQDYTNPFILDEDDTHGKLCYHEDVQKLWDYCHEEQKYLMAGNEKGYLKGQQSNYCAGMISAYRKIQFEISRHCSKFDKEND